MTQSRSETLNSIAARIVCAVAICAALPIGVVALVGIRLAEAAHDSHAGKALHHFWYGRRGS